MLPDIQIEVGGTVDRTGLGGSSPAPIRFRINGHLFEFTGSVAEIYALRRDLEDARKFINAARSLHAMLVSEAR